MPRNTTSFTASAARACGSAFQAGTRSILAAAESGELSLDFLESPGWELPPRLGRTYRQLAEERSLPEDSNPPKPAVTSVT